MNARAKSRKAAVAVGALVGRHGRQPPLAAALESADRGELPRAAGLLGDLFVQQSDASAAEHAYRAAIHAGHPDWSPVAQVALARLLSDRGDRMEAQTLLEAAIASGNTRTNGLVRASLDKLLAGDGGQAANGPAPETYETLGDLRPTRRPHVLGRVWSASSVRRAVVTCVVGLVAGIAAMAVVIGDLPVGADSPAIDRQESAAAAPQPENRIVRDYANRIARRQLSMEDFKAIAGTRVANGDWTSDLVDRIVNAARTMTLAGLYQGCRVYSAGRLGTAPGCHVLGPPSAVDHAPTRIGTNDPLPPRITERGER